jgi:23S rRNA (adenine2503-C2)-methyltransferase
MTTDLPAPTSERPQPGQLTFSAPRRGKPPRHLADLSPAERTEAVVALGHKGFRAKQLSTHYFERLVESPEEMTDLPKAIRDELVADLLPTLLTPLVQRTADDGMTIKSAWKLHDGAIVESVLMRYPKRVTICISSQAGCGMNCPFCATGQAGLTRNMSAAEIVEQVVRGARLLRSGELSTTGGPAGAHGRHQAPQDHEGHEGHEAELGEEDDSDDAGAPTGPTRISNVVFMGMGEALANYKAAIGAIRRLTDPAPDGLGMSARGITMSTVGLVPAIDKLAAEGIPVTLALSLHAPDDELRSELVPINTRWTVHEAVEAAWGYAKTTKRRVSIEYAMMRDINDQAWRADLLADVLTTYGDWGWVHVNLIPLNPTPGSKWTASRREDEREFVRRLEARGIPTTVRDTRGRDIDGACGQLAATE